MNEITIADAVPADSFHRHVRQVRTTEAVFEGDELFAHAGALGEVVGVDVDGMVTVRFVGAPALTTCYLGHDCEPVFAEA
ncbi:MAG: hypothetical protein AB1730_26785 [Myxococcota bacterium]